MKIRLGYVAIALNLPKITSSSTLTFTRYKKILSDEKRLNILKDITRSNIKDLDKIINYNIENDIHFYRLTSKLIPLATHPEVLNWDYEIYFQKELALLGEKINQNMIRVDCHPDQFNVINSIKEEVFQKTKIDLKHQLNILKLMNNPNPKMILHIGSSQGGKGESIKRFINNFFRLPQNIQHSLIIENDDKIFTAEDVLTLCQELKIPMVLDYHHYVCNHSEDLLNILNEILDTWNNENLPPKIHISSPKRTNTDRSHADFINPISFINLVDKLSIFNRDIDIILEAKMKDKALFKLVEDIKELRKDWEWIDGTTLYLERPYVN